MATYPITPSQLSEASVTDLLNFIKSPTQVAKRFGEILSAQQFLGYFLLQGRYTVQGGAIAVPVKETIRTVRGAETVAAGSEYKLTPIDRDAWEVYVAQKEGLATEVTDEEIGRSLRQPIDDALQYLQTELVFGADELALAAIRSAVTQTRQGKAWTSGKAILADALGVQAATRALKLGYDINTVVLPGEQYAEVMPELFDVLPKDSDVALTGGFPTIAGMTWVSDDSGEASDPLFTDRTRLGGIARERIPSPEYRPVGTDTGVEIAVIREPKADSTRLQARNPHVPVIANPRAGFYLTGTS